MKLFHAPETRGTNFKDEMKPPPFSYHDPETVAEVVGLLGSHENTKLLDAAQRLRAGKERRQ